MRNDLGEKLVLMVGIFTVVFLLCSTTNDRKEEKYVHMDFQNTQHRYATSKTPYAKRFTRNRHIFMLYVVDSVNYTTGTLRVCNILHIFLILYVT